MNKKLSIVIPCYNEEKNIPLILEKFSNVIFRDDIEIILVNNGSIDNSEQILNDLVPLYSFATYVTLKENKGYGYGISFGLKHATGDFMGWTHADMQTDPEDVIKALAILERENFNESIYVKGRRRNRPFFDEFFTNGMSIFETIYMREKLVDINAQPNIFHNSFYEKWENVPYDFSLDLYVLYHAQKRKLKIIRFDVVFPERIHGESSWNKGLLSKWKFIKRTLTFSKKLKAGIRK